MGGGAIPPSSYIIDKIGEVEFNCTVTPTQIDVRHYEKSTVRSRS